MRELVIVSPELYQVLEEATEYAERQGLDPDEFIAGAIQDRLKVGLYACERQQGE